MARAFPQSPTPDYGAASPTGDWQALRGELVALLDQVEGQYARSAPGDPALAGFAERMRDLRYQVAEVDPDDRRREALRSVSRQLERFNDRGEPEPVMAHADNVLQTAIQQIRARTQERPVPAPAPVAAPQAVRIPMQAAPQQQQAMAPSPRFDDLAMAMATLTGRLGQLESELKAQRNNGGAQMREIADQVAQLSHVVELVAGAVGETGQVKRLESQIAGLAQMVGQTPKVDLAQFTERLDVVAATVDRLADLQIQQLQHSVRESETAPNRDALTARSIEAIETSVRSIYDRIDSLENSGLRHTDLDGVTNTLSRITAQLDSGATKPDTLLNLVDALNSRLNEIEYKSEGVAGLRGEIDTLRDVILGTLEPRFAAIEGQLGDLGERISTRLSEAPNGLASLEAQVRQLVARMDQTGVQLAELARLYNTDDAPPPPDFEGLASLTATRTFEAMRRSSPADFDAIAERAAMRTFAQMADQAPKLEQPDYDGVASRAAKLAVEQFGARAPVAAPPDFDGLAERVATRTIERMSIHDSRPDYDAVAERAAMLAFEKQQRATPEAPDYEALVNLAAARTSAAIANNPVMQQDLSADSIAAIEARMTKLVEDYTRNRSTESLTVVQDGIGRVEDRLARLETSFNRREMAPEPVAAIVTPAAEPAPARRAMKAAAAKAAAVPSMSEPVTSPDVIEIAPVEVASAVVPRDAMPRSPATEAPLTEFGFPDLSQVAAALEARTGTRKLHPGMQKPAVDETTDFEAIAAAVPAPRAPTPPSFDPATAVRPPRPESSLAAETDLSFVDALPETELKQPAPVVSAVPEVSQSSRNTFIEAARRAAQRQNGGKPAADSNSPIGRAMSRFQPGTATADTVAVAATAAVAAPAKPTRAEKAAAKAAEKARKGLDAAPVVTNAALAANVSSVDAPSDSFLLRHRRGILLAASVVAISVMAANLVMQRLNASDAPASPVAEAPAQPVPTPVPAAPKPISEIDPATTPAIYDAPAVASTAPTATPSMIDPTTTASIDPGEAMSFAPSPTDATMPPALAAVNAVAPPAATAVASADPTAMPAAVGSAPTTASMDSPVKVDLPPDNIGPLDLRQTAAGGDARAQFEIAAIYSEGRAVPQDYKNAAVWYERAGAQGFAPAQYRLGNLYENGKGVDKDLEQAKLWYQRAAEGGNRMAMHNLAALYAGGQFGKQDFASAAEWFQRAADLGMKDSEFNLGMLYARGLGVTQNLETSYKWFALAATGGDTEASKARDDMGRSLDAAALKRATDSVSAWKIGQVDLAANFAPIGTWNKSFDPGPAITSKDVVSKVQVALMRLGFDVGTPDGQLGGKTTAAIKAFEGGTGMTQVGAINPRLLAVLGSQPV